jgi:hypothetical protein
VQTQRAPCVALAQRQQAREAERPRQASAARWVHRQKPLQPVAVPR